MERKSVIPRILPSLLIAVLLFLLVSTFSYYSDDWFWGTDGRLSTFFDSFSNPENPFHFYNNGRYFGNGFGFLAANHRLLRDLIMTVTLWVIIVAAAGISLTTAETDRGSAPLRNIMLLLCGTVLLLCPKELFRESVGWSVAFMNYVVPSALYLICLKRLYSIKEKTDLTYFLLPLLSSFFIENLTIGNAIFIIIWLLYRFLTGRKPSKNEWLYLAGALIGLVLMLSDDGYRQILGGEQADTYWGAQTSSIGLMIGTAVRAFRNFIAGAVVGRMTAATIFGSVSLAAAYLLSRGALKGTKRTAVLLLSLMDILIALCFLLRKMSPSWEILPGHTLLIEAVLAFLYLASLPALILLLPYSANLKEKLIFTWIFAAVSTLPLTVAEPLAMREFFPTYVFLLLFYSQLACKNLKEISERFSIGTVRALLPYALGIFLSAWGYLFSIYAVISHYERERIKYVRYQESLGFYDTIFPTLPYPDHVIVSYPWEDTWQERYKKFFGLNLDMRFNIVSFEEWKEQL